MLPGAEAVLDCAWAAGSGCGTGGHCTSDRLPGTRLGSAPVFRYATIRSSVQATPDSEPACVEPSLPSMSEAVGNSRRVTRLPANGVAASNV